MKNKSPSPSPKPAASPPKVTTVKCLCTFFSKKKMLAWVILEFNPWGFLTWSWIIFITSFTTSSYFLIYSLSHPIRILAPWQQGYLSSLFAAEFAESRTVLIGAQSICWMNEWGDYRSSAINLLFSLSSMSWSLSISVQADRSQFSCFSAAFIFA